MGISKLDGMAIRRFANSIRLHGVVDNISSNGAWPPKCITRSADLRHFDHIGPGNRPWSEQSAANLKAITSGRLPQILDQVLSCHSTEADGIQRCFRAEPCLRGAVDPISRWLGAWPTTLAPQSLYVDIGSSTTSYTSLICRITRHCRCQLLAQTHGINAIPSTRARSDHWSESVRIRFRDLVTFG